MHSISSANDGMNTGQVSYADTTSSPSNSSIAGVREIEAQMATIGRENLTDAELNYFAHVISLLVAIDSVDNSIEQAVEYYSTIEDAKESLEEFKADIKDFKAKLQQALQESLGATIAGATLAGLATASAMHSAVGQFRAQKTADKAAFHKNQADNREMTVNVHSKDGAGVKGADDSQILYSDSDIEIGVKAKSEAGKHDPSVDNAASQNKSSLWQKAKAKITGSKNEKQLADNAVEKNALVDKKADDSVDAADQVDVVAADKNSGRFSKIKNAFKRSDGVDGSADGSAKSAKDEADIQLEHAFKVDSGPKSKVGKAAAFLVGKPNGSTTLDISKTYQLINKQHNNVAPEQLQQFSAMAKNQADLLGYKAQLTMHLGNNMRGTAEGMGVFGQTTMQNAQADFSKGEAEYSFKQSSLQVVRDSLQNMQAKYDAAYRDNKSILEGNASRGEREAQLYT